MSRRRSTPWIHRSSRLLIAAVATCGALVTGYLTIVKFSQGTAACPTNGCDIVLTSQYATVFGLPLALFGFLAYGGMAASALIPFAINPTENKNTRLQVENSTWLLLLAGSIAMTVFSGFLMYLLAFQIKALCLYCIGSAIFSTSMLILTIIGRNWEDIGQIFFTAVIVIMLTLVGTGIAYSGVNNQAKTPQGEATSPSPVGEPIIGVGWPITTTSGEAEIQLAKHLKNTGAKMYFAWTCPHCYEQKQLFGKEAVTELDPIECRPDGKNNPRPELCEAAKIPGYPSWIINGQLNSGVQSLEKLSQLSGYKGPRNFKNFPGFFK
jgi:uncharacterized membrane protein